MARMIVLTFLDGSRFRINPEAIESYVTLRPETKYWKEGGRTLIRVNTREYAVQEESGIVDHYFELRVIDTAGR